MYQRVLTGLFLGAAAVLDVRYRRVSRRMAAGYLVLVTAGHLFFREAGAAFFLTGILPGVFCFAVSWITREGLGYGDSLMVLLCGLSLGFSRAAVLILAAFFLTALLAALLLSLKKADRKTQLPFLPFLFLADLIWETFSFLGG